MKTASLISLLAVLAVANVVSPCSRAQAVITTYAGGLEPASGSVATTQIIDSPLGVAADGAGGFYFTGARYQRVFHVDAAGILRVIAGTGIWSFSGDGGPAIAASLSGPHALTLDAAGNLYIAEYARVRKVTADGKITTVAGNGNVGLGGDGGPATSAELTPAGLAVDSQGNLLITDNRTSRVRKVSADGTITLFAGGLSCGGLSGDNGPATSARLCGPNGISVDTAGSVYIADSGNNRVRKISPSGIITTVAGNGQSQFNGDGLAATQSSINPSDLRLDRDGNLLIADSTNFRIRKVSSTSGIMTTVAGSGPPNYGNNPAEGIPATLAGVGGYLRISVDPAGNIFVADANNYRIRRVDANGIIRTVAGTGAAGFAGDGGPATAALLTYPMGLTTDRDGNLYIADSYNDRIRKVATDGTITTVAGGGSFPAGGDGGPALLAGLSGPVDVDMDAAGNLFIADICNTRTRKVVDGIISTLNGATGNYCDPGEHGTSAFAVDATGTVFIIEVYRIVSIGPDGRLNVVAGTLFEGGFRGDGGPATLALFSSPSGIAVDAQGNVLVADSNNHRVRRISRNGIITTIAGNGTPGFSGDNGPGVSAQLSRPTALAVDGLGNLFILDGWNNRIRMLTPNGVITTVVENPSGFDYAFDAGLAVDADGNLFASDLYHHRVLKIAFPPTLSSVKQDAVARGATLDVTLSGNNLVAPITIDAGAGIAVSNIRVVSRTSVVATLNIGDAALGPRSITVTSHQRTSNAVTLTVFPESPDLSVTSVPTSIFGAGFNGSYSIVIRNAGALTADGPITVTDTLPDGFTYLSATGNGWSCAPAAGTVSCVNSEPLEAGASTSLTITVSISAGSPSGNATNVVNVGTPGDLIAVNNTAESSTAVASAPEPQLVITAGPLLAGQLASAKVTIPAPFPFDITGNLKFAFLSNATNPTDDPAIQFETGGRAVSFVIPANTMEARFGNLQLAQVALQTGTVSGTLTFEGRLQVGTLETSASTARSVAPKPPMIHSIKRTSEDGPAVVITLSSTMRSVTGLRVEFFAGPPVQLSCGAVTGCSVSGITLTFDVKSLFDDWYRTDTRYGSLATLRLPFSIPNTVRGTVSFTLVNALGASARVFLTLP